MHTRQSVEDDGSSATLDIVDGSLREGKSDGERNGVLVKTLKCLSHLDGFTRYGTVAEVEFGVELLLEMS